MGGMSAAEVAFDIARVFVFGFMLSAPAWSLVAFAAYVAGRRQYGLGTLYLLILVEAVAIMVSMAALAIFTEARE